jgi:ParB-like chromosome segregation protein Spo0J
VRTRRAPGEPEARSKPQFAAGASSVLTSTRRDQRPVSGRASSTPLNAEKPLDRAVYTIDEVAQLLGVGDMSTLADSIRELGLLQPITVTPEKKLVAGGRRLAAFKMPGRVEIPAFVKLLGGLRAELAEIDENLVRLELMVLERGEQLARRNAIRGTDLANSKVELLALVRELSPEWRLAAA